MYLPFTKLPSSSRTWIYASNRTFTWEETERISARLLNHCNAWNAHGTQLETSFTILEHRFIVLGVNQDAHAPSGCSIDSSVAILRQLETELNLQLLDAARVNFRRTETELIEELPLLEFKKAVRNGELPPTAVVYQTNLTSIQQLDNEFAVPLTDSWAGAFLPQPA